MLPVVKKLFSGIRFWGVSAWITLLRNDRARYSDLTNSILPLCKLIGLQQDAL
jgi:hypothetical protein